MKIEIHENLKLIFSLKFIIGYIHSKKIMSSCNIGWNLEIEKKNIWSHCVAVGEVGRTRMDGRVATENMSRNFVGRRSW